MKERLDSEQYMNNAGLNNKSNCQINNQKRSQRKNVQSRMTEGSQGKDIRTFDEEMIRDTNEINARKKRFMAND